MKCINLMHNGDIRNQCPFWNVKVWDDCLVRGELIGPKGCYKKMQSFEMNLPKSLADKVFILPDNIHELLAVASSPKTDDVIVYFKDDNYNETGFIISNLPDSHPYRKVLEETVEFIIKAQI